MTDYEPGTPSWVDLGSPDPDVSARFYGELFGWEANRSPEPEAGGYLLMTLRGKRVAGIGPLMAEGQPPVWTTYISVADADAVAASVPEAGGNVVMPPMDVMDQGRMALFADPAGAVFGVWEPRSHRGAELVNEPGALCWNELMTRDVDGARAFYPAVFGWGTETTPMGGTDYTVVKVGDRSVAGMIAAMPEMPAEVPSHWSVCFAVADTDATLAQATELGAQVAAPAMDIEGVGRFAALTDPLGAPFGVLAMPEAAA